MKAATLSEARAAKEKLLRTVAKRREVNGVGITRAQRGYAIKLNLSEEVLDNDLPTEVDGVQVRVEVVGSISKRGPIKTAARRRSA
jgi:hypothetical protein